LVTCDPDAAACRSRAVEAIDFTIAMPHDGDNLLPHIDGPVLVVR
jgi:hypothetical protein